MRRKEAGAQGRGNFVAQKRRGMGARFALTTLLLFCATSPVHLSAQEVLRPAVPPVVKVGKWATLAGSVFMGIESAAIIQYARIIGAAPYRERPGAS